MQRLVPYSCSDKNDEPLELRYSLRGCSSCYNAAMRPRLRVRHLVLLLALFASQVIAGPTVSAQPVSGRLLADFQRAATQSGVPLAVLVGLAWEGSMLADHAGPSIDGGYGLLDLSTRPDHPTLRQAAKLVHLPPARLRSSDALNLLGGALLLAHQARQLNHGKLPATLAAWAPVLPIFTGMRSAFAARLLVDDVYRSLRQGITTATLRLVPLAGARPLRRSVPHFSMRSSRATETIGPPDYRPATWTPADYSNYTDAKRPAVHPIRSIVIHDTEGSCAAAVNTFQNSSAQASAHYLVCLDGTVIQLVHERDIAWHAGNWQINLQSIGIEHEGYRDRPYYTRAQYLASAALVRYLSHKYGINPNRGTILGHENVPAADHTDPGPNWNWAYYMANVRLDTSGNSGGSPAIVMTTGTDLVYTCPQVSCTVLGSVNWGERFAVQKVAPGWVQVDYAGRAGWLAGHDVLAGAGTLVRVVTGTQVRAGPAVKDAAVGTVSAGQTYVAGTRNGAFWVIDYNHRSGFLPVSATQATTCTSTGGGPTPACLVGASGRAVALPNAVQPGDSVTLGATGLAPNRPVTVSLNGESVPSTVSSQAGTLVATVVIPQEATPGTTAFLLHDGTGTTTSVPVQIEPPAATQPRLTSSTAQALPGAKLQVGGQGFPPIGLTVVTGKVALSDGSSKQLQARTLSDAQGALQQVSFALPVSAVPGPFILTATSGEKVATLSVTIAPAIPPGTVTPAVTATPSPTVTPNSG